MVIDPQHRLKSWLIGAIGVFLFGVIFAYLFRTETLENPELGVFQYKYRWGIAHEEQVDTNRDGTPDYRAIFDGTSRTFDAHGLPREFWEDRDHDGVFEIHAVYSDNRLERVELDRNGDGIYDEVLVKSEAEAFFQSFSVISGDQ